MAGRAFPIPYCGSPTSPAELPVRWNPDPVLIAALAILAAAYVIGADRAGLSRREPMVFAGGWALTAAALISPLCPLSVSLFAARVGQHMDHPADPEPCARDLPLHAGRSVSSPPAG